MIETKERCLMKSSLCDVMRTKLLVEVSEKGVSDIMTNTSLLFLII